MFDFFKKKGGGDGGPNAFEKDILKNIKKHGWQANFVFDPEDSDPPFTYSIGFPESLGAPDFIIFGMSQEIMHHMLWEIFRQIKDGKQVKDGARWDGLLGGDYSCVSRKVDPNNNSSNYFNSARWWHGHTGRADQALEFYQMFWPGVKDKRLPWDAGCHQDVIARQPKLYEPGHDYE